MRANRASGLAAMVAATALTMGCSSEPSQYSLRGKLLASNQTITGTIVDVKSISRPVGRGFGGANTTYEILTIELPDGTRKKILSVQPTEFSSGDVINEKYLPVQRVPLADIYDYTTQTTQQTGTDPAYIPYLSVDGILGR